MRIVNAETPIRLEELTVMSQNMFDGLVKAVVDVNKNVMVVDAELHVDEEQLLLEKGSQQEDVWSINLYPEQFHGDFIEYDSMINLRPSQNNRTRNVDDPELRVKIAEVVYQLIAQ